MGLTTINKIKQITEKEGVTRYLIAQKSGVNPRLLQHIGTGQPLRPLPMLKKLLRQLAMK